MKKILIIAVLLFSSIAYGQEHFKFKGIEIDGTEIAMVKKLETKGYEAVSAGAGHFVLYGNFANYECSIVVFTTKKTNTPYCVIVSTKKKESWSSLKVDYKNLVEIYSQKYGKPGVSSKEFEYPFKEGDEDEEIAVRAGKCVYFTMWRTVKGTISITTSKNMNIDIVYTDTKNEKKMQEEQKQSALDDI